MEKWSWIRIRNPISTKIEFLLQVHPLVPPTKFGGDPWTRSWDILRTKTVRTDRHTDTQTDTRRWPQDLAAYGAQVIKLLCPRGTQTCALAVANIAHAVRLTEMEKWSWICIRNPISTKIELVLQVTSAAPTHQIWGHESTVNRLAEK